METLTLTVADGTKMQAFASFPEKRSSSAIIVLQEAFGVNSHIKHLTEKFAKEGYIAIAPELYHRTAPTGSTFGYNEFEKLKSHFTGMTAEGIQQDVQACYDWLTTVHSCKSIAAIGYCLGGRCAFIANASVPLSCAISYYGGRIVPDYVHLAASQKSPILFFWGGLDKHIPADQLHALNQALTAAQKKFICTEISDAEHAFSNDERPNYNAVATGQAWALTTQFLKDYNSDG